jgi:hypothetical protein
MGVFLLALLANNARYVLTGYFDLRYFAPWIWFSFLLLFYVFHLSLQTTSRPTLGTQLLTTVSLLLFIFGVAINIIAHGVATSDQWDDFHQPPLIADLAQCIEQNDKTTRILFYGNDHVASIVGALGPWTVALTPQNIAAGHLHKKDIDAFVRRFEFDYILAITPQAAHDIEKRFPATLINECSLQLYRVRPKAAP